MTIRGAISRDTAEVKPLDLESRSWKLPSTLAPFKSLGTYISRACKLFRKFHEFTNIHRPPLRCWIRITKRKILSPDTSTEATKNRPQFQSEATGFPSNFRNHRRKLLEITSAGQRIEFNAISRTRTFERFLSSRMRQGKTLWRRSSRRYRGHGTAKKHLCLPFSSLDSSFLLSTDRRRGGHDYRPSRTTTRGYILWKVKDEDESLTLVHSPQGHRYLRSRSSYSRLPWTCSRASKRCPRRRTCCGARLHGFTTDYDGPLQRGDSIKRTLSGLSFFYIEYELANRLLLYIF